MTTRNQRMRQIAEAELTKLLPGVAARALDAYATSIVRQWLTNDGHAGIFTVAVNYWLQWMETPHEIRIGSNPHPSRLQLTLQQWDVLPEDVPAIVEQLSIAQNAHIVNTRGITVRVTVNPKERTFRIAEVTEDSD